MQASRPGTRGRVGEEELLGTSEEGAMLAGVSSDRMERGGLNARRQRSPPGGGTKPWSVLTRTHFG